MKQEKGFTLVEILVVLSLLTVIFGLGLKSFSAIEKEDRLQSWSDQIESALNYAKMQALSGASLSGSEPLSFGVYFSEREFVLFAGEDYLSQDPQNIVNQLPASLYFETIDLPADHHLHFQKISGQVTNFDPLHHQLILREKNSNRRRVISINKLGVVEITQ